MAGLFEIMRDWNDEKRAAIESADQQRKIDDALPVAITARGLTLKRSDLIEAGWEIEGSTDGSLVVALLYSGDSRIPSPQGLRLTDIGGDLLMLHEPPRTKQELTQLCEFLRLNETKYTLH